MEVLINELSLKGQYNSEKQFIESGITPFVSVLRDLNHERDVIYKKSDLYNYNITSAQTLYGLLSGNVSREYDVIRKFKSLLFQFLFDEPYWEYEQKHSLDDSYLFAEKELKGSSLAEACERDRVIISFHSEDFNSKKISILKNDSEDIVLDNLFDKGHCNELNWERKNIGIEEYCINRFKGNKLDFSQIDKTNGFSLLKKEDESLFIDGFRKFTELSWQQIGVDDALDYKPYPDNGKVFKDVPCKIHKFRISRKYRCFGYVDNGIFYVLRFDLEHKLSD
jgi:hypothetical protein